VSLVAKWTRNTYPVTFDTNGGGSAPADQSVAHGLTATDPGAPARTGYRFDGWYADGSLYDFSSLVTGPVDLVAHWTRTTFTVSFNPAGGNPLPADQTVGYGLRATDPGAPTRTGYTFGGWYLGSAATAYDFTSAVTGAITLTAHWTPVRFPVTFDPAGGSSIDDQSVAYRTAATDPGAPTRTGYTFNGWYDGIATTSYDFSSLVTAPVALTAHWTRKSFTVSFDTDGGSTAPAAQTVLYGNRATSPADPTRTGRTFTGWFAGTDLYGFTSPVTADVALVAHWTKNPVVVSFDSAGGSPVADRTVGYGDPVADPGAPTRTGYTFDGWYADKAVYDFTAPVTAATTLTAHWTPVRYPVSFDSNGGGADPATQDVAYGTTATNPADPTRTGYRFDGWFAGSAAYDFTTSVTGAVSLVAHWTKKSYPVSFDTDGGSTAPATQSVLFNDTASAPVDPTKAGYTFAGWFAGADAYDFTTPVTGAVSLVAHWTKKSFTVTFDSNGGDTDPGDQTVLYNDLATLPGASPTRTGYTFDGWYAAGSAYDFTAPVTGNLALVAHWTANRYPVTFDTAGGSAVDPQSVAYNTTATRPDAPTKQGWRFDGWFTSAEGATAYDFTGTPITAATTIYAHWTRISNPVTFDTNGGSANPATQTVVWAGTASAPADPTRAGWTFLGWFAGDTAYDFTTPVTGPVALVAHWSQNMVTVSFDTNGGSINPADQTVAWGDKATAPPAPTKTGRTFTGWFTSDGTAWAFGSDTVTRSMTLIAHWIVNSYPVTFDTRGGSVVDGQTVLHNATATRPQADPTRTGYAFAGWFTAPDGNQAWSFSTPITQATTIYAHWTANLYPVVFDSQGGTSVVTQNVAHDATATRPADPTRTGYTFDGWFLDGASYVFSTPVTGPVTLVAHWTIKRYTVTIDPANSQPTSSAQYDHGSLVSQPADPTRTGWIFQGWYVDGAPYSWNTPVTSDLTIVAHWTRRMYPVDFDSTGGTDVATEQVAYLDTATAPVPPTRLGYTFQGWFTSADGNQAWDFSTPITQATTLYAHWTRVGYVVSFVTGQDATLVAPESVPANDPATKPADPTRFNYVFQGWFTSAQGTTAYDWTSPVTHDITLYAQWIISDIDGDGISDADEVTGRLNTYDHCPTNPSRADSDGDGLTDGQEIRGFNLSGTKVLSKKKTFRIGHVVTDPCRADTDGEGLTDRQEVKGSKDRNGRTWITNPANPDTDLEGLTDKQELDGPTKGRFKNTSSNPLNWDTDHGGISDYKEVINGSNPADHASTPNHPRAVPHDDHQP
jgi:uncharacterized repeat protein (TIGR02543 family)